ncbi:unnamed protein product [Aureobasidium mustum]|uniref:Uncharacterized protein n=1 Tax=Aureobasidium mustum TaxID=2773714 RepID=A0A9N8PCX3_9PEZI|nr:unnamed protein product [Aureobasidium mustum]
MFDIRDPLPDNTFRTSTKPVCTFTRAPRSSSDSLPLCVHSTTTPPRPTQWLNVIKTLSHLWVPPDTGHLDQTIGTSLGNALCASDSRDAAQYHAPTDATADDDNSGQSDSILALDTLETTTTSGTNQDSTGTANTMGESDRALLTTTLSDQPTSRIIPSSFIDALSLSDSPAMTQDNTFEGDVDDNIFRLFNAPELDHEATSESRNDLPADARFLGAQLESVYETTSSPDMKQIIACLVHLDVALTKQTRLNSLHEAHTAKNFREQRHLNKDRKFHLLETMQNVKNKFARFDAERMETERLVKTCEIRINGYGTQLRRLQKRVKMLASGGEWMEAELNKLSARFEAMQQENAKLKSRNKHMKDRIRGLEEEVDVLKERDGVWERRMTALEVFMKETKGSDWFEVSDPIRFSVGSHRVFSIYH